MSMTFNVRDQMPEVGEIVQIFADWTLPHDRGCWDGEMWCDATYGFELAGPILGWRATDAEKEGE